MPTADMTEFTKAKISAKVKRVFGFGLHSWEQFMLWSLGGAALAAVAIVVTTASVVILTRDEGAKTKKEFEEFKIDAGVKLAEARAEAETKINAAQAEIAKANERTAILENETAKAKERTAELDLTLQKEREKTAPRPWNKEQYDAILSMKGEIAAVAVISQKDCLECRLFTNHLVSAFHEAGAEMFDEPDLDFAFGTGIFVFLPPGTADPDKHPVVMALKKADLNPGWTLMNERYELQYSIRIDVPIVQVGERFPQYLTFPYFSPGNTSWTSKRLRNR